MLCVIQETKAKAEELQRRVMQTREEAEQIRRDCQAMIRTYQVPCALRRAAVCCVGHMDITFFFSLFCQMWLFKCSVFGYCFSRFIDTKELTVDLMSLKIFDTFNCPRNVANMANILVVATCYIDSSMWKLIMRI